MSLVIKGLNMPKNCLLCPCCAYEGIGVGRQYYCQVIDEELYVSENHHPKNCPLIEIPIPHGRLIDADRLKRLMEQYHCNACDNYNGARCSACWVDDCFMHIDDTLTIIEAEASDCREDES